AATASFSDKNYGIDKTVTLSGLSLGGADAGLYFIGNPTTTATINKRLLSLSNFTADDKEYDGTTSVSGYGFDDDRLVGDFVTIGYDVQFESKTIGTDKTVGYINIEITGGTDANNYYLVQNTGEATASITIKTIYLNATVADKVYDGNTTASINDAQMTGVCAGDDVTLENHTTGTFDSKNVGENINVQNGMFLSGVDAGNYSLSALILTGNITPKGLTVTGTSAQDKEYNGSASAVLIGATLNGAVEGDDVDLANYTSGTFAQITPGTDIPVTPAMTLTGTDAGNYTLTQPSGLQADITTKTLSITDAVAQNKVYDGTTDATITGATLSGVVKSDDVALQNETAGTFQRATAGRDIPVTTAMTLSGSDAGYYTLTQPVLDADITKKELTVTGAAAGNKTYDGTTLADIKNATPSGAIGDDDVQLANHTSGTFVSKNVGEDIAVSTTMTLTGTDANNYSLTQPAGLTANITQKELSVTGASAQNKVYDRTSNATIAGATLSGKIEGDDVALTGHSSGTFAQVSVGNNIVVTVIMNITGADAPNYDFTPPTGFTANITPQTLTITANNIQKNEGEDYTFLGTEFTSSGLIPGDAVSSATLTSEGAAADAPAGSYPIIINNATGTGLSNYTLTYENGIMTVGTPVPVDQNLEDALLGTGETNCYNAQNDLTVAGNATTVIFQAGSAATLIAGHSIRVLPGFHAQANSYMSAYITTTGSFCDALPEATLVESTEPETNKSTNEESDEPVNNIVDDEASFDLYPNPTHGEVNFRFNKLDGPVRITVFSNTGARMLEMKGEFERVETLNLSHLRKGICFVCVEGRNFRKTSKLIIR
ncbi:MAG TPA: YDG domain-containing protein, partial [Prolixibacteraceae bacterium]|nr:YDG domain-containing protein [Prolixibacteraceae bacterium]